MPDFSFDGRVAGRYDRQRAHPPDVSREIGRAIVDIVGAGSCILELGVGTGRIAAPVAAAGCPVVGVDLSREMLGHVAGGVTLVQGDIHHLPFAGQAFDAVLAVHVLHLAQDPQRVLKEAARVVKSGGFLIRGKDWIDPESVVGRMRSEMRRCVTAAAADLKPPSLALPAPEAEVVAAAWTVEVSPADYLHAVATRTDAESWVLPPDLFEMVLDHLQRFAAQTWPDTGQKQVVRRRFVLSRARL